ncbi:endonuclease/exonuclease/phosphatase family protein [Streptomonospora sp. PA3]|uniref:endonuclease/exonuclease/phosphatase family protein n=1 Tax=Streptomonospora sp. PA3 TaxID=2607326 RepID=UPI0012DF708D|nr:endonuclease/exonuclease/phosphatase family protein [Streptomonospora sp. PA3]MUL41575.1 endonuclease/exonuclease/phosphatase family protein [Streptomonospora sp. PA3]
MTALTIMSQNLKHGGIGDGEGNPEDRWPRLAETITAVRPDILCLQECHGWSDHLHHQTYRAEKDLGMRLAGLAPGRCGGGNAVFYRPSPHLAQCGWADAYAQELYTGLGIALFHVAGLPARLAVASTHLTTTSAEAALDEAMRVEDRVCRYGGYGVMIGDINAHPLHDGGRAPDPATIKQRDRACRYDENEQPDRRVARRLHRAGLVDAADHLATRSHNYDLYAPTGQGRIRVDQAWLSPPLASLLTGYERIPTASDHDAITITLALPTQITLYPPAEAASLSAARAR